MPLSFPSPSWEARLVWFFHPFLSVPNTFQSHLRTVVRKVPNPQAQSSPGRTGEERTFSVIVFFLLSFCPLPFLIALCENHAG